MTINTQGNNSKRCSAQIQSCQLASLIKACCYNDVDTMYTLLKSGIDPNLSDNNGMTALMWAVRYRNANSVILLLQFGADLMKKDNKGETVLMKALEIGHSEINQWLDLYYLSDGAQEIY